MAYIFAITLAQKKNPELTDIGKKIYKENESTHSFWQDEESRQAN